MKITDIRPRKLHCEHKNQFVIHLTFCSFEDGLEDHTLIRMPSSIVKDEVIDFLNFIVAADCHSFKTPLSELAGFDKWANHDCHGLSRWFASQDRGSKIVGIDVNFYDENGNRVMMEIVES
jgi:hypothetical protein